jgi:hypothetical protein
MLLTSTKKHPNITGLSYGGENLIVNLIPPVSEKKKKV